MTSPDDQSPSTGTSSTSWLTIVFFVGLALLISSFPARNSDIWRHLALGRQVLTGDLSALSLAREQGFPSTPLFDILGYAIFSMVGGTGLVFVKALLVVAIVLLLLRLASGGCHGWVPLSCVFLALLAMGTRLLLQPVMVSYLLLAVTLWLVWTDKRLGDQPTPALPSWQLFVVFIVWANCDQRFVLGLFAVALCWLGQLLDGPPPVDGRFGFFLRRGGAWLLLVAGCLLNPAHVQAFTLPPEIAGLTRGEPGAFTSPFGSEYGTSLGLTTPGLAYYPLLVFGLLSFLFLLPRIPAGRLLPWIPLAVLSTLEARAIPFFAIVAGPVLAMNYHEFARQQARPVSPLARRSLVGVILGMILLVCAWPGWLQAPPYEPRRWLIETSPVLEHAATTVRDWYAQGTLHPESRGLHFSPQTTSTFAWFCPEDKAIVDLRLVAAIRGERGAPEDWQQRMRSAGIDHLIVYEVDRRRREATLDRLLSDPKQWPLLFLEGSMAIFGWRDPTQSTAIDRWASRQIDLERLAFQPPENKTIAMSPPTREPRWYEAFWKPARVWPIDRDEAMVYYARAESLLRSAPRRHRATWQAAQLAGLVTGAANWSFLNGMLDANLRLTLLGTVPEQWGQTDKPPGLVRLALVLQQSYHLERDDTSPALLYLAIRASRRAIVANPGDAQAHLVLGESYVRLLRATRERVWTQVMPELLQLRQAQASAALNRAIALNPDQAEAHLRLFELYQQIQFFDLGSQHLRTYLRLAQKAGPPAGVDAEQFQERKAQFEELLRKFDDEVDRRQSAYASESAGAGLAARATYAWQMGLAGKALTMLRESDVSAFGDRGTALQFELLLRTGQSREVVDWTSPEQKEAIGGASHYYWLRTQALAASGDYDSSREECTQLARALGSTDGEPPNFRKEMAIMIGRAILEGQVTSTSLGHYLWQSFGHAGFRTRVLDVGRSLRREADVTVLRGLLALEQGQMIEAELSFLSALSTWTNAQTAATGGSLEFNGRRVAEAYLQRLR